MSEWRLDVILVLFISGHEHKSLKIPNIEFGVCGYYVLTAYSSLHIHSKTNMEKARFFFLKGYLT